jgi:ATP-binding cassette subfamily C protein CydD
MMRDVATHKTKEYTIDYRLLRLTQGVRPQMTLIILIGLGVTGFGIALFTLTGYIIGQVISGEYLQNMIPILLLIAGFIVLKFYFLYYKEILGQRIATRMKVILRKRIYNHLLKLGPGYIERRPVGELVTAAVHGIEQLEFYFSQFLPQLII